METYGEHKGNIRKTYGKIEKDIKECVLILSNKLNKENKH